MGVGVNGYRKGSSSYYSSPDPNPDPGNFKIEKVMERGEYIVLLVKYPNCKNYEGKKIMVIKDTLINVINCRRLDPHFSPSSNIIARLIPTDEGWKMAESLCSVLNKEAHVRK